jgi:hypothetical protein
VEELLGQSEAAKEFLVVSAGQLRGAETYKWLVVVGPARWYPDHLLSAPRAARISIVQYDWLGGSTQPRKLFDVQSPGVSRATARAHVSTSHPSDEISVLSSEDWEDIYETSGVGTSPDDTADAVKALPFALEGGWAVWLDAEEGGSAMVVDLDLGGRPEVHRVPVPELEKGMFLLLRTSGGGDYIVAMADRLLGPQAAELRSSQANWKERLRNVIRRKGVVAVCQELKAAGAPHGTEGNLRRWVWNRSIKPHDRSDFDAVLQVAGLGTRSNELWRMMTRIDRAHRRAGQAIRKQLLRQARSADLTDLDRLGRMSFDLPGIEAGSLEAFRIVGIGSTPVGIPDHRLGHPFETTTGLS